MPHGQLVSNRDQLLYTVSPRQDVDLEAAARFDLTCATPPNYRAERVGRCRPKLSQPEQE